LHEPDERRERCESSDPISYSVRAEFLPRAARERFDILCSLIVALFVFALVGTALFCKRIIIKPVEQKA
jgi:hypothetical protein